MAHYMLKELPLGKVSSERLNEVCRERLTVAITLILECKSLNSLKLSIWKVSLLDLASQSKSKLDLQEKSRFGIGALRAL